MAIRPITLSSEQRANLKPLGNGVQTGGLSQLTGVGEMSPIQKILSMGVLSDKVSGSDVSALSSLGFLPQAPSADVQKRQRILGQAAPVLERITTSAMKAPTGWTGWWQALKGKIPGQTGGEAEYLSRDVEGFARLIASAFASEVGVATDKDVRRWKAILPRPGDTMEERKRQSRKLIEQIQAEAEGLGMEVPPGVWQAAKAIIGQEDLPSSWRPD